MSKPVPGKYYCDMIVKLLDEDVKRYFRQSLALTKLAWHVLDVLVCLGSGRILIAEVVVIPCVAICQYLLVDVCRALDSSAAAAVRLIKQYPLGRLFIFLYIVSIHLFIYVLISRLQGQALGSVNHAAATLEDLNSRI